MEMIDDGDSDAKVLSVPEKDPRFKGVKDISDLENHLLEEIQHFFKVYKDLQKKPVEVRSWQDKTEAEKTVLRSISLYKEKY
jgi:inorganic pyrophosphatase